MQTEQSVFHNQVMLGDCLELMNCIPPKSIRLVLADLPYGKTMLDWDKIIDFKLLWCEFERLITDDGVLVFTSLQPFSSLLIMSKFDWFREELIWLKNKSGNGFNADQKHIKIHENIIVFSKSITHNFNPQKWLVDKKEFLTQRKTFSEYERGNNVYGKITKSRSDDTGELRNPLSIIACRVPFTPSKSKEYSNNVDLRLHPTQKPVELFEYLIKTYTDENDLVLDCCAGSGTTAIACLNTNRKYICIEKEQKYFDIMNNRIQQHTASWQTKKGKRSA